MTMIRTLNALAAAAIILAGCTNGTAQNNMNAKAVSPPTAQPHAKALHDPSVIPNEYGPKLQTTNKHGNTTNGMGTTVYSTIGSSGLHSTGFSAHLESRLSGSGISDVRVFVFDDTVILATETRGAAASQYDPVQQRLLGQTDGLSTKNTYEMKSFAAAESGASDNLMMAASKIKELLGADVKVLTVTGAKAVKAIENIRTEAQAEKMSPDRISDGIEDLLELVEQHKQK